MSDLTNIKLHQPEAVEFTFDAIGWSILLAVVVMAILIFAFTGIRKYVKNKYRREAIKTINENKQEDAEAMINNLSTALKSVAIKTYGREKVASLSGDNWLNFLIEKCPKVNRGNLVLILQSTYNTEAVKQLNDAKQCELKQSVIDWIQQHA